jgi:hypothetical protein
MNYAYLLTLLCFLIIGTLQLKYYWYAVRELNRIFLIYVILIVWAIFSIIEIAYAEYLYQRILQIQDHYT